MATSFPRFAFQIAEGFPGDDVTMCFGLTCRSFEGLWCLHFHSCVTEIGIEGIAILRTVGDLSIILQTVNPKELSLRDSNTLKVLKILCQESNGRIAGQDIDINKCDILFYHITKGNSGIRNSNRYITFKYYKQKQLAQKIYVVNHITNESSGIRQNDRNFNIQMLFTTSNLLIKYDKLYYHITKENICIRYNNGNITF